jgi:hypothetical protein
MNNLRGVGNIAPGERDRAGRVRRLLLLRAALASLALLVAPGARAQLLDGIDVEDGEGAASQIIVRFSAAVQYLRHVPQHSGSTLRIYIQVTGPGVAPVDLMPTTMQFRGSARVPRFSATFPETGSALMLVFEREVRFINVGQGPDNRSIAIALSAARD